MAYVIVFLCGDVKYYVQDYTGGIRLNGLVNNAKKLPTELHALKARQRYAKILNRELHHEAIPKTKN